MRAEITTVGELVAALAAFPPQTRVQLAVAPGYPQAATIGVIAAAPMTPRGTHAHRHRGPDGVDQRRHRTGLPARDRS